MDLLRSILDIVFPPRATELVVRQASAFDVLSRIEPREHVVSAHTICSLLRYEDVLVQSIIKESKFHKNRKAMKLLGEVLATYLPECIGEIESYGRRVVLVPIPLSKRRLRSRGYNQVVEVLRFAETSLGRLLGVTHLLLERIRDTSPQTTLNGTKRSENMYDAFRAGACDALSDYVLIDDVTTTGATLIAAHKALSNSGARHITLLSLAH